VSAAHGEMARSLRTLATHMDRLIDQLLAEIEAKRRRRR
jgi:hypothetical protein